MNDLAHQRRAVLQEVVERLGLHREAARARPLGVLGLELAIELRWLERGRDGVEVGRVGVNGGRGAVRS